MQGKCVLAVLLAPLMVASVAGVSCKKKPQLENPAEYKVTVGGEADGWAEPVTAKDGFALHARRNGNNLILSAQNNRQDEIVVYYRMLAFVPPPSVPGRKEKPVLLDETNARLNDVLPLILGPGERGVMTIPMTNPSLMDNALLVYNNPKNGILFPVKIE